MDRRVSPVPPSQVLQDLTRPRPTDFDPGVSQSTQLLQHALAPAPQSQDLVAPPNDGNATIDLSLDSKIIPARSATPRYHAQVSFSQSPDDGREHTLAEDSQQKKLRQKGSKQAGTSVTSPPSSNNGPLQLESGSELYHQHGNSPVTALAGKVIGTRTVSFDSPLTTSGVRPLSRPTKSMPSTNRYSRRSPSLPSQDSFGGSVSQDPAELYLASAKPFDMPLSDLGETPTQEVVHPPADPDMTLPDASEHKEFLEAAMRKYDAQRADRATSNRRTNILVAATPRNSGESSDTSRHKDDNFSFHNRPEVAGQEFEFNGSSSFDKMLDRDLVDASDPSPDPAQLRETEPTQVDGPVDVQSPTRAVLTTPPPSSKRCSPTFEWIAPAPSGPSPSSNPRSLLRALNPANQYRIAKMRNLAGVVESPLYVAFGAETQPSGTEENQPYQLDESTSKDAFIPTQPASPKTINQLQKDDDELEDGLDVVPDSEPLRAGPSTRTPNHYRTARGSPVKRAFSPISLMSEHGSADLVPDSLEVEESEADIPLVIEAASRNTKRSVALTEDMGVHHGKTRGVPSVVPEKASPPVVTNQPPTSVPSPTKGRKPRVWPSKTEFTEVPTSLPEQDLQGETFPSEEAPATLITTLPSKKKTRGLPPSRARRASVARLPATKPVTGVKRSHESDTESSEDPQPAKDEGVARSRSQKDEEEFESANDQDADSPPPPPKREASRKKRKCAESGTSARGVSKSSTSTRNKRSETPAAAPRSGKRLRSAVSSTRGLAEPATRVFALWKQDGHYYSGVVYSRGLKNKHLVKFDDGTEDEVDPKNMRRRELTVGDRIIIARENTKGVVSDVSQADSQGWFTLEIDNGEAVSTRQMGFPDICIANRTIQSQWKERTVTPENIVTVVRPKPLDATPSKQSVIETNTGKAQRELIKTGFVVTINPKNEEPTQTKDEAMRAIKQHGGLVIEDWSSVFSMEGKHSHSNKRWMATPQDFRWKPDVSLDRVFLLSDDAHQKPKFLMALALGIPCLSFEWLTKDEKFSSDWQPFLLPAGYSDTLGARISQLVDLDWGNCTEHLTDIMTSRVPIKLFSQKTVLCIGADLVPLPSSRARKNTTPDEASRYVPWIILCMGAAKVEAVTDTKQVSSSQMQAFDYVIVKERDVLNSVKLDDKIVVGDVSWVKECLVSSRLSPPELD